MSKHDQLIAKLTEDLANQNKKLLNNTALTFLLSIASLLIVALIMLAIQDFRAGWFSAALDHPRYLAELVCGFLAIIFLMYSAIFSTIPGSSIKNIFIGVLFTITWILIILTGFIEPTLEASMAGKRESCELEAFIYSIPLMAIFSIFTLRRYSTRPWLSASLISGAAGIIPAYLMQIACMYEIHHTLTHHLLPALVVIVVFTPVIAVLIKYYNK